MAPHQQYQISGRMHVVMQDGSKLTPVPAKSFLCRRGHDAWVTGEEPVVAIDWQGASVWARPQQ